MLHPTKVFGDGRPTPPPTGRPFELSAEDAEAHHAALWVVPFEALRSAVALGDWIAVAAFLRTAALTCCKSAEHGWPGGSFSCTEIMIVLHLRSDAADVVLSKGHAAAMEYAVRYAAGKLSAEELVRYKAGAHCPEAHADVLCDTGSLGQCLSVVAGMAASSPTKRFGVVMGDGELQEGQNYEALMTINKYKLTNVTIVVDINGFQSDNRCDEIMPILDLPQVLAGFGFTVIEVDGHDCDEVLAAWQNAAGKQVAILATTVKGGGTVHMPSTVHPVTKMDFQGWHTKIPSWQGYVAIIEEQLCKAGDGAAAIAARTSWNSHRSTFLTNERIASLPNTHRPGTTGRGTGKAFGERIVAMMAANEKLTVVSADLATSCGFNSAVGNPRYFELGVAEQDACSFAAGLALRGGFLPVFGTYSNFLKRCFENIFINLAEGVKIIYAGTYSGLCYHTDGKSHQSINDVSVFVGMPGLIVSDPVSEKHAEQVAEWACSSDCEQSVYVRLRRTACVELELAFDAAASGKHPVNDLVVLNAPSSSGRVKMLFVAMGTVSVDLALKCSTSEGSDVEPHAKRARGSSGTFNKPSTLRGAPIVVVTALNASDTGAQWDEIFNTLSANGAIVTIEDDAGALKSEVARQIARAAANGCWNWSPESVKLPLIPKLISKTVNEVGPSFRTLPSCLEHHGFTIQDIQALVSNELD